MRDMIEVLRAEVVKLSEKVRALEERLDAVTKNQREL